MNNKIKIEKIKSIDISKENENNKKIQKEIKELEKITGLKIQSPKDNENINIDNLNILLNLYNKLSSKENILLSLLNDKLYDTSLLKKSNIDTNNNKCMYLVKLTKNKYFNNNSSDMTLEILKNLFSKKTYILQNKIDEFIIIYDLSDIKNDIDNNIISMAHNIRDTLNSEAMLLSHISYTKAFTDILKCSILYKKLSLSLNIALSFYPNKAIFPADTLGIAGLLYHLPIKVCENFISEIFGNDFDYKIDEETEKVITVFFENNLNIAETSRKLHMHRNTLVYRLEQIENKLNINIRNFEGAMLFNISNMILKLLKSKEKPANE